MPVVDFNNVGSVGLIKDIPDYQVPQDGWTTATNIRFHNNTAGKREFYGTFYGTGTLNSCFAAPLRTELQNYWIQGGKTYVAAIDSVTTIGLLSGLGATLDHGYQLVNFNSVPVINNGFDPPYYWQDTSMTVGAMSTLTAWPVNNSCKIIKALGAYLIALNINKFGKSYPNMVKWSHQADPGLLPSSWDQTDPTLDAGETVLIGDSGAIIDALNFWDRLIIYRDNSIWDMRYTGFPEIFAFRELFYGVGLLTSNAVTRFPGGHAFWGNDNIYIFDGANPPRGILDNKVLNTLFDSLNPDAVQSCFAAPNPIKNEIFFCYPTGANTSCNMALVWNYKDNTFTDFSVPGVYSGAYGPTDINPGTWNSDPNAWDDDTTIWDQINYNPSVNNLVLANNLGSLYRVDSSANAGTGLKAFTATLERTGLTFGDITKVKRVKRIWPLISSSGTPIVQISIGFANYPGETVIYDNPHYFYVGNQESIECNVSGRLIAIKFETTGTEDWILHGFSMDVEIVGERT